VSQRRDIENAVIRELSPLLRTRGRYLKAIEPYNGPLAPEADDHDLVRVLLGRAPAVLVSTGSGDYDRVNIRRRMAQLDIQVELLVLSGNLRSGESRNRGDGFDPDPGVYQIIEDVREHIFGIELGVRGVGWLVPAGERPVIRSPALGAWQLTYQVYTDAHHALPGANDPEYQRTRTGVSLVEDERANPIIEFDHERT